MPATVVLVHGACHGAWCWHKVVAGLTDRDIPTVAIDLTNEITPPAILAVTNIDGIQSIPAAHTVGKTIAGAKFYEHQRYLTLTAHTYTPQVVIANPETLDALVKYLPAHADKAIGMSSTLVAPPRLPGWPRVAL